MHVVLLQGSSPDVTKHFIQPLEESSERSSEMLALIIQKDAFSLKDFAANEQHTSDNSGLTCPF